MSEFGSPKMSSTPPPEAVLERGLSDAELESAADAWLDDFFDEDEEFVLRQIENARQRGTRERNLPVGGPRGHWTAGDYAAYAILVKKKYLTKKSETTIEPSSYEAGILTDESIDRRAMDMVEAALMSDVTRRQLPGTVSEIYLLAHPEKAKENGKDMSYLEQYYPGYEVEHFKKLYTSIKAQLRDKAPDLLSSDVAQ